MVLEKDVKELVAFDEEIKTKVDQAHQAKISSRQRVAEDKKNITEATWSGVKKRVVEEKIKLDEYIKHATAENEEEYQKAKERLLKMYEENKAKWINELVNNSCKL